MGQSTIIQNADFSQRRDALPILNIPPFMDNVESFFVGAKYNADTGICVEPNNADGSRDLLPTSFGSQPNNPAIGLSSSLNNKPAIYLHNESASARSKALYYPINYSGNKLSMNMIFVNQNSVALTVTRYLFSIAMANGQSLAFEASGPNSKMAIAVNGVRTELDTAIALQTAIKVRIEYNAGQLDVYVNNVLDKSLPSQAISNFIGTFYLGSNPTGATSSRMHGYVGAMYNYRRNFSAQEGTQMHNFLSSAYL